MNITKEKTESVLKVQCESEDDLTQLLDEKKKDFFASFNQKYSHEFVKDFVSKNISSKTCAYDIIYILGVFISLTACASTLIYVKHNGHFPFDGILAMTSLFTAIIFPMLSKLNLKKINFIERMIAKRWLKKDGNIKNLINHFFLNELAENDVLKAFTRIYGKEAIGKLMIKNEYITYHDLKEYIKKEDHKKEIEKMNKEKMKKFEEVIECLSSDK